MTTDLKFCKDCKHYRLSMWAPGMFIPGGCHHPNNMGKPDLVSGIVSAIASPSDLRLANGSCGEEGLMFEAKPPEPPPRPAFIEYVPPLAPSLWDVLTGGR